MTRVVIIGAGHVGATAAYAMMLRALFREIVLIDSNVALAEAQAADLRDANALARPCRIWSGTYEDAASAQIAVITAGAATHGAESRLSVAGRSAEIVLACVDGLVSSKFGGVILVASNPVDLMTLLALRRAGLPPGRVLGTGALLDSSRLKQALALRLGVAPGAIDAAVLGEHGDSEVAVFSTIRVGGVALDEFGGAAPSDRPGIGESVRDAGYSIVTGKGYTAYGVATAIVRICEAIVRDEKVVLPVSTFVDGQLGLANICLSLPCLLGAGGIERVLTPQLSPVERVGMQASATALRAALAGLPA